MDDALFSVLDDGRFQATDLARGPWDPRSLHGGPVAALAARGLEAVLAEAGASGTSDSAGFVPARLTVELERPVGLQPLTVAAEVTRPGRSVRTADLTIHDDAGRRLVRATLVAIRRRPEPLNLEQSVTVDDPAPSGPGSASPTDWTIYDGPAFHRSAVEHHFVTGTFDALGPATDWIRLVKPVVPGESPSPLQRVAAASDFGNGISAAVPHATHTFINPDLTITLTREAEGDLVAIDSKTRIDANGVGATETVLWDKAGRIGMAIQTLVVEPR